MAKNNSDDARNWSMGDMAEDQAKVRAVTHYEETGRASYGDDKKDAEKEATRLRGIAARAKNGAVVEVKNTGGRRNADWTVIVSVPKKKR